MPVCCSLTRRQALSWAALVAATPLLSAVEPSRAAGPTVPMNLELVTLTETSVVLTWYTGDAGSPDGLGRLAPVPADTEVLLGTNPAALTQVLHDTTPTPYHYAEIGGLEPGQTYFYVAQSGGVPAAPAMFSTGNPVGTSGPSALGAGPFVFTTPQPPPGRYLFTLALCNDLHVGETTAGLITSSGGGLPPGFSQLPGRPPYPEVMATALVADTRARGAHVLLAAGDLTSEAAPADVARARELLDGFGTLDADWFVARGNHDRPHTGNTWTSCSSTDRGHDCFRDVFYPGQPGWFTSQVHGLRLVGLDTYDKAGNGGDNGSLSAAQWDFVTRELARDRDRPTLVLGHHPVPLESNATSVPPVTFGLDEQQGQRLEALYAGSPGVFLHQSGHTHRNKRVSSGGVVFQEVSAVKEYPGGFSLLRVHEGGYALNFYKTRSGLAREWSERTRQEDFGGVPYYVFGTVGDRNSVVARDFSGLAAVPPRPVPGTPVPGSAGHGGHDGAGGLAATGAGAALPVTAAALLTAAALGRKRRSVLVPPGYGRLPDMARD